MKKIEPVVYKETVNIAVWSFIFSAVMEAVFLVIGKWDTAVLLGNLLGYCTSVLNFFIMALGVQIALEKDPHEAKQTMKLSQSMRFIFLFVIVAVGAMIECFNVIAVAIPLLFPRLAIFVRMFFMKNNKTQTTSTTSTNETAKEDANEG